MNSPTGGAPLPTLHETELNAEQMRELFVELDQGAKIHEVRVKSGSSVRSLATAVDLTALHAALSSRRHQAVQIIYTQAGRTWIDTLMPMKTYVRLVRMRYEPLERR